jgi:alkylation response protein AidB-like acyl-CoA dehydrogenase
MNLDKNAEQTMLADAARKFLQSHCPSSLVRSARENSAAFPPDLWQGMAEMGWMSLTIDQEYGGLGGSFADLTVLLEAMGAVCLPAPYFNTAVVSATAIARSSAIDLKKGLLPRISVGKMVSILALIEPDNSYGLDNIQTTVASGEDGFVVNGIKLFVEHAQGADYFLTVANNESKGLVVLMVDANSSGISLTQAPTLDYSKQCEVHFCDVQVPADMVVATGKDAESLLLHLEKVCAVGKCAEMVGAMQTVLDMTVQYSKDRTQFGQPIGGFQSIQHHCANMAVDVDSARYLTGLAAWKVSEGLPAAKEVSMAKSFVSKVAIRVVKMGHQVHGAISFCDEFDMHLFLRKVQAASMAFGDSEFHQEKVAVELGL